MENNEDIAKNPNNFPIKFVEQKESKHLYPYKKVIPEKEINKKKKKKKKKKRKKKKKKKKKKKRSKKRSKKR